MSVTEFKSDQFDMTANTEGSIVKDPNGAKCALIKVQTNVKGLSFESGMLFIDTRQKDGEVWVYVQAGATRLTISHQELGKFDYTIPEKIERAKTYILTLAANVADGGAIDARVFPEGSEVFLDGKSYGKTPIYIKSLAAGDWKMEVKKDGFKTLEKTIDVVIGEVISVVDSLEMQIALTVDNDADIYVDNRKVGFSSWKGYLPLGVHVFESRKANHRTMSKTIQIDGNNQSSYKLDSPTPIYGSLQITSFPDKATVKLDGTPVGQTPCIINQVLIGTHRIELSKSDYQTETIDAVVKESQQTRVEKTLNNILGITFKTNVSAYLTVNGQTKGYTPVKVSMASGDYDIRLYAIGYKPYKKVTHIDAANPNVNISLKKLYLFPTEFYIDLGAHVTPTLTIGGSMGFFIKNWNFEGGYYIGMSKSEEIFWSHINEYEWSRPQGYQYSPTIIQGRFGYGFVLGTRCRLTPQLGADFIKLNGGEYPTENPNVFCGTGGIRFDVAYAKYIGFFIKPEFLFAIKESPSFKALSEVSSDIKAFGPGLRINVGLFF